MYKTFEPETGRYYIGRHSTTDINDCYLGSGLWVTRASRKGRNLIKEILSFHRTEKTLIEAESKLLKRHFGKPNCMNLTLSPESPLSDPNVHIKTMKTRKERGSNIFETRNPMLNPLLVEKKVAKTRGKNHYYRKRIKHFMSRNKIQWSEIIINDDDTMLMTLKKMDCSSAIFYKYLNTNFCPKKGLYRGVYFKSVKQ